MNETAAEIIQAAALCVWLSLPLVLVVADTITTRPGRDNEKSRRRCAGIRFINR